MIKALTKEIVKTQLTPLEKATYALQLEFLVAGKVGQLETSLVPAGGSILAPVPVENRSYATIMSLISVRIYYKYDISPLTGHLTASVQSWYSGMSLRADTFHMLTCL